MRCRIGDYWGDLGVCFGCVVRVESTRKDPMASSREGKSSQGDVTWASPMSVPMVGTCFEARSCGGVPMWDKSLG